MAKSNVKKIVATMLLGVGLGAMGTASAAPSTPAQSVDSMTPAQMRAMIQDSIRELFKQEPQIITNAIAQQQAADQAAKQAATSKAVGAVVQLALADPQVPTTGPKAGKVVAEFFDYNCHYCKVFANETITPLVDSRRDVRMVYVYTPILGPGSIRLAEFAAAAQLQGKFVAAHNYLIGLKGNSGTVELADAHKPDLIKTAGLDAQKFNQSLASGAAKALVEHHVAYAKKAEITGTPMVFANGRAVSGAIPMDPLVALLDGSKPKPG